MVEYPFFIVGIYVAKVRQVEVLAMYISPHKEIKDPTCNFVSKAAFIFNS